MIAGESFDAKPGTALFRNQGIFSIFSHPAPPNKATNGTPEIMGDHSASIMLLLIAVTRGEVAETRESLRYTIAHSTTFLEHNNPLSEEDSVFGRL